MNPDPVLMIFFRSGLCEPLSSVMSLHNPQWNLEFYLDLALILSDSAFTVWEAQEDSPPEHFLGGDSMPQAPLATESTRPTLRVVSLVFVATNSPEPLCKMATSPEPSVLFVGCCLCMFVKLSLSVFLCSCLHLPCLGLF